MLVKDTQLYKEGIKDRPKRSFIRDFISEFINLYKKY